MVTYVGSRVTFISKSNAWSRWSKGQCKLIVMIGHVRRQSIDLYVQSRMHGVVGVKVNVSYVDIRPGIDSFEDGAWGHRLVGQVFGSCFPETVHVVTVK